MPTKEINKVKYYFASPINDGFSIDFADSAFARMVAEQRVGLSIRRVIFHDPATIVIWADGSKTVVKVHDEPFDEEKGLAMAILKKLCGKAQLRKEFKKWIKEEQK